MKKLLASVLVMAMLVSFGMGAATLVAEELTSASNTLTLASATTVETMDYVLSAKTSDHEINANLVDGLLEHDSYGHLVGALAESWEPNEDATVWTFHLKEDIWWMNSNREPYDTVKADDFVTGLRHGAEFGSETSWLLMGVVEGYSEYLASDFSDEAFESVGVKAIDDLTLEYTLEVPVPYFDTMTTYAVLYPINREFLEGRGEGCVLGSPNKENCAFGNLEFDNILYNGGFYLTKNDDKSVIEWEKNEDYWDAENVYFDTVTYIYDDGADPYSLINGFESGTYPQAALRTTWEDYDSYLEKYADNAYFQLPNNTVFGVVFNFNRQSFNETNYAEDETLRQNTRDAVLNENFRKALRASYDVVAALAVSAPEELAEQSTRHINNFPGAGTTSDGRLYHDLVNAAYTEMTGEEVDLNDGGSVWLSKEDALAHIEAAKEDGIEFPVHLDMLVPETSDSLVKRAQSMKKSIEDNTDGQIVLELVMRSMDTVQNIAYRETDPAKMDYDISTFTGWGPDYGDPKSFVDIWSPTTGYYMAASGLGTTMLVDADGEEVVEEATDAVDETEEVVEEATDAEATEDAASDKVEVIVDEEIKEIVGLMEYEQFYREADAITDDMDLRYETFAKADAKLIEKAFYIPTSQQTRGQVVSYYVPFSNIYADYGVSDLKFKGIRLQEEIVTVEQRDAASEDWYSKR